MKRQQNTRGFTLIELSIVLVIIGLIVGGVLVGQDLIRAAKFRQMASDQEQYRTAAMTFKLKYDCLPGDCPNAQQFWGQYCQKSGSPNTSCNGNGSRLLSSFTPGDGAGGHASESYMFWRHLFLAGFITQDVTGACEGARCGAVKGINIPKTAFDVGMYAITDQAGSNRLVIQQYGTVAPFGWYSWGALHAGRYDPNPWSVGETRLYDLKFDDGVPNTGGIVAGVSGYWSGNCGSTVYGSGDAQATCDITYTRWVR